MKLNWGVGAFSLFGAFVIFMLSLVYYASLQRNELVTEQYYEKELEFKEVIKKQEQTESLSEQLSWNIHDNTINIKFPNEIKDDVSGKIFFFKPSNKSDDIVIPFQTKSGVYVVDISHFSSGMYKMRIDWQSNNKEYYNEEEIVVP